MGRRAAVAAMCTQGVSKNIIIAPCFVSAAVAAPQSVNYPWGRTRAPRANTLGIAVCAGFCGRQKKSSIRRAARPQLLLLSSMTEPLWCLIICPAAIVPRASACVTKRTAPGARAHGASTTSVY